MENGLKGKHVLFILLGFFSIVFAVNGVFLYDAISTLPGEERGATYEAGLRYNATLAAERAQDSLRWSHKAEVLPDGSKLVITMKTDEGIEGCSFGFAGRGAEMAGEIARQVMKPFFLGKDPLARRDLHGD